MVKVFLKTAIECNPWKHRQPQKLVLDQQERSKSSMFTFLDESKVTRRNQRNTYASCLAEEDLTQANRCNQRLQSSQAIHHHPPRQYSYLQHLFSFSKTSVVTSNKIEGFAQALYKATNGIFFSCSLSFVSAFVQLRLFNCKQARVLSSFFKQYYQRYFQLSGRANWRES